MERKGRYPCIVCERQVNLAPGKICSRCGDPNEIRMYCATCHKVEVWNEDKVMLLRKITAEAGNELDIPIIRGIVIRFNACCVPELYLRITAFGHHYNYQTFLQRQEISS